jgi:dTDP-4-dehydrorhamnose 3,5-epimerase
MIFKDLALEGAYLIQPEPKEDARGLFARTFCVEEFAAYGLQTQFSQCSTSYNRRKSTLRGMHYQADPKPETKIVRCTRGRIVDVILDLRPTSKTYCQWTSVELTADNRCALYIPPGVAHGFQTLEDDSEVFYHIDEVFVSDLARGVRWNDPVFGIRWPLENPILSDRDRDYPDFQK